ncbi:MAG: MurR/RpiR family transcriptional regulator [Halobacteriovoraceae bacterium]|jgi:DNA-binding MurR/RpiR family transcriptional regulator|nr:MurR/RpiR family transcriptional regulator [Halobacteriovoraceae bacterium]
MNLFDRIKNTNLPIKQLKAIETILEDLESNSFLSGAELSEKMNISFSSLTRLAKALNFSGFPELKKEIEKMYKDEFSPSHQAKSFLEDTRDNSILKIVFQSEIKNLNGLIKYLNENELIECAKKINKAKRVFVIGIGQMELIAKKFADSLSLLSKNTVCYTELGFSKLSEIHSISKQDVVITFSINKELVEFQDFFIALKEKRVHSTLFTDKKTGRLRKHVDMSFHASSTGNGMVNCITPFIVVTNILESILFSMDKHVHLGKVKNIEKKWNSLPIFLE